MSESMRALRERLRTGGLTPAEFREHMHACHSRLFEYAGMLEGNEIATIELSAGKVLFVTRDGMKFAFDPLDCRAAPIEALNFGSYEPEDAKLFWRLVGPDQTVLDVGAHIGWYAIHAARTFPTCHAHAFEPVPASYAILERNVVRNDLTNVVLHPYGLSDKNADATFYVDPHMPTAASSANITGQSDVRTTTVSLRRLDELNLSPDVIKIDVEGAELAVLRGGLKTLARCRPGVFCEMLRKWAAAHGTSPDETIELMHDLGYDCCFGNEGELRRLDRMSAEITATNFLFLHTVRHADMLREVS